MEAQEKCRLCFWSNRPYSGRGYNYHCYLGDYDYVDTDRCYYLPDIRVGMNVRYANRECVIRNVIVPYNARPIVNVDSGDLDLLQTMIDYINVDEESIVVKDYFGRSLTFNGKHILLNGKRIDDPPVRDIRGYVMRGVLPRTRLLDALLKEGFVGAFKATESYTVYVDYGDSDHILHFDKLMPVRYVKLVTSLPLRSDVIVFNKWLRGVEKNIKAGRIAFRSWSTYSVDTLVVAVDGSIVNRKNKYEVKSFIESLFAGCKGGE